MAWVRRLWLHDVRNVSVAELDLPEGLIVLQGANGQGKSNVLEALGFVGTLQSFRRAPLEALVRHGAERAVIRAEVEGTRSSLVEIEIAPGRPTRVLVNRQRLTRSRELLGVLPLVVFAPSDLELVQAGPAERRRYLDEVLVSASPRLDGIRLDLDRVLRQRNALLRQCGGRLDEAAGATLDVWDAQLGALGDRWRLARRRLVAAIVDDVQRWYRRIAAGQGAVELGIESTWGDEPLQEALREARRHDVARGLTTIGPHRDELAVRLDGLGARVHASQGEQRTLALSLRLAARDQLEEVHGAPPLLLLDDVLSELDPVRSASLVDAMSAGQVVLTTADEVPAGLSASALYEVDGGVLTLR